MIPDLEQIAEEMQDRGGQARAWAMRLRAWIAANKESPQNALETLAMEMEKYRAGFDLVDETVFQALIDNWSSRIRRFYAYTDPCDVCGTGMFQACPRCDERILNLSPQRKAFVEAAIAHFEHATCPKKDYVPGTFDAGYQKAADLYIAMIEAEKVDNG